MFSWLRKSARPVAYTITDMSSEQIEDMIEQKHNLIFQQKLCDEMMKRKEILPFPFHRVVVLLTKEKRFEQAITYCRYVENWCAHAEAEFDGKRAMHWKSPKLIDLIERIPKLQRKIDSLRA